MGLLGDIVGAPLKALGIDPGRVPVIGSLFGTDEEEAAQRQFKETAERYRQMRPEIAQSRSNALGQQFEALRPSNAMIGRMSGDPNMMIDFGQMATSPLTPGLVGEPQPTQPGMGDAPISSLTGLPMSAGIAGGFGPGTAALMPRTVPTGRGR